MLTQPYHKAAVLCCGGIYTRMPVHTPYVHAVHAQPAQPAPDHDSEPIRHPLLQYQHFPTYTLGKYSHSLDDGLLPVLKPSCMHDGSAPGEAAVLAQRMTSWHHRLNCHLLLYLVNLVHLPKTPRKLIASKITWLVDSAGCAVTVMTLMLAATHRVMSLIDMGCSPASC